MNTSFFEYYRCPEEAVSFLDPRLAETRKERELSRAETPGTQGDERPLSLSEFAKIVATTAHDIQAAGGQVLLPCDLDALVDCLRLELYTGQLREDVTRLGANPLVRSLYYWARPLLPVAVRSIFQKIKLFGQMKKAFPSWPVDRSVDLLFEKSMLAAIRASGGRPIPFIWFWPEGKQAAFILTHDVEERAGKDFCPSLMDIDDEYGFKASFQIIPEERYSVEPEFLESFRSRGFEICVHDLNHDGNLYTERAEFRRRAGIINGYGQQFRTAGFRSGALYRNALWYGDYRFSYDMSIPNVAHLDPQHGGCCTLLPYFIGDILEIPVTGTQDYSLFHILDQYKIDLWVKETEMILNGRGIISLIIHPDYILSERALNTYRQLLGYLEQKCKSENVWATLPSEIDRWWRARQKMKLFRTGDSWQIEGPDRERAKVAYASIREGRLEYTIAPPFREFLPGHSLATGGTVAHPPAVRSDRNSFDGSTLRRATSAPDSEGGVPAAVSGGTRPRETLASAGVRSSQQMAPVSPGSEMALTEEQELGPHEAAASRRSKKDATRGRPLRICMVAYTFYESDNRVMRYAEALAQEGHEVEVFALQHGGYPTEEVLCGVKVHRLQERVINEKNKLSYGWRILQFLIRSGYWVSREDWKRRYDLIHVHSVPDFLVFSALLPRLKGTPVILDIHDILPEFYAGKFGTKKDSLMFSLLCSIERVCAKFASHVIIANHLWKERIESRSVAPTKCSVVMNSPDPTIFRPSRERPPKGDRFLLLYPGTLNWHQGLDIAVRSFAKISAQVPQADFHIYGEGPLKQQLSTMIRDLGLEGRVVLSDVKRLREVPQMLEMADLGIVPKRKDGFGNEAFSTKILEFMTMGVPVIVSDTRIDQYYFNDSVVRFFRSGNEEDLARCMLDLIEHPEKRRALVDKAREFVAKQSWSVKKQDYLDLVGRLTHRRVTDAPAERA